MMQTIPQCHSHDNSSRSTYLESMQRNEIINEKVKIFMKEVGSNTSCHRIHKEYLKKTKSAVGFLLRS